MKKEFDEFPGFPVGFPFEGHFWKHPVMLDLYWDQLSAPDQACLRFIMRHTFGFQKTKDRLSLNQFVHGIKKRDGSWLDKGTNVSRSTVQRSLKSLVEKGFIKKIRGRKGEVNTYEIRYENDLEYF